MWVGVRPVLINQFLFQKSGDAVDGIKILWDQLLIVDGNRKLLFEEFNILQDFGGIDDAAVQER